jgi:hypothetical protein
MWVVLKIEVKNNYSGNLEYVQENIIDVVDSLDEAKEVLKKDIDETIERGYFDKIIFRGETMAQLTNGGTAYLKYNIHKI